MNQRIAVGLLTATLVLGGCGRVATPAPQPTFNPQPTSASQPTSVSTTGPGPTGVAPTAAPATAVPAPATAVPAPATAVPAPATAPQLVAQFLDALRADPSGRLAAPFAGGPLAQALESGTPAADVLLGEPLPFDSFSVDRELPPAPPFSYVQVTLAYGNPAQRRATRLVTVKEEGGALRVTEISQVAADDPAQSAEQQARNATAEFLVRLSEGRFQEAGARFGGDLAPILAQHPDLSGDPVNNPELRGQLLERHCRANGGACLGQRRLVYAESTGEGSFTLWVEFNRPDGSMYQDAAQPLRVRNIDGGWLVLDLPPIS